VAEAADRPSEAVVRDLVEAWNSHDIALDILELREGRVWRASVAAGLYAPPGREVL
jgi:hypothetical protein